MTAKPIAFEFDDDWLIAALCEQSSVLHVLNVLAAYWAEHGKPEAGPSMSREAIELCLRSTNVDISSGNKNV